MVSVHLVTVTWWQKALVAQTCGDRKGWWHRHLVTESYGDTNIWWRKAMVTRTIGDRTICWRRHIWRQENLSAKGIMMRIHTDYKMERRSTSCSSVVSCRTETLVVNSTTNLALLIIIVRSSSILFVIGMVVLLSISKHLATPQVESGCNLLFCAYIVHICY